MTLTNLSGLSLRGVSPFESVIAVPAFGTNLVIDASGEKAAFIGSVWAPGRPAGTVAIRKVHFRCGAVTLDPGSVFRTSLQDVSAAAGAPYQPDGTQDQTADLSALNANAWNTTGNLSADRTVSIGARLAVVFEYATFTTGDSVVISQPAQSALSDGLLGGAPVLFTTSWQAAQSSRLNNVVLELSDGTYAFLRPGVAYSNLTALSFNNTSAVRAAGVYFKVAVPVKLDALSLFLLAGATADFDLILYDSDGSTVLRSLSVDANSLLLNNFPAMALDTFSPITLAADTFYRYVAVPTTANNISVYYGEVNTAAFLDFLPCGSNAYWTQRDSAGAWTETTTRVPHWGFEGAAFHDGAGGSIVYPRGANTLLRM